MVKLPKNFELALRKTEELIMQQPPRGCGRVFSNEVLLKMPLLLALLNLSWMIKAEILVPSLYHSLSEGLSKSCLKGLKRTGTDLCLLANQRVDPCPADFRSTSWSRAAFTSPLLPISRFTKIWFREENGRDVVGRGDERRRRKQLKRLGEGDEASSR